MNSSELFTQHRRLVQIMNTIDSRAITREKDIQMKRDDELQNAITRADTIREKIDDLHKSSQTACDNAKTLLKSVILSFFIKYFSYPSRLSSEPAPSREPIQIFDSVAHSVLQHSKNLEDILQAYTELQKDKDKKARSGERPKKIRTSVLVLIAIITIGILLSNAIANSYSQSSDLVFLIFIAGIAYIIAGISLIKSENLKELGPLKKYTQLVGISMFIGPLTIIIGCFPVILFLLYIWGVGLKVFYERYQMWLDGEADLW